MARLQHLQPVSPSYATMPVEHAFDWHGASEELVQGEWYLVAFRSVRRDGSDEVRLIDHDHAAHQEASAAPGFIHYFQGPRADDGSCLSFCLWDSRADARAAAALPAHRAAVSILDEMYASYTVEFQRVTRSAPGAALTFEPYDRHPSVDPAPATPAFAFDPSLAPS